MAAISSMKLIAKDDGWLASLYDALARIRGPVRDYLTDPSRMKRFYTAVRGRITSPGPARPVFRSNTDMMLLTTRLRMDANGKPHIPGSLEVWKTLFTTHPQGKYDGKLTSPRPHGKNPTTCSRRFSRCAARPWRTSRSRSSWR